MSFGYNTSFKLIDKGVIEMLGPFGSSYVVQQVGRSAGLFQSGLLYHYTFVLLIGGGTAVLLSGSLMVFDPTIGVFLLIYYCFDNLS
jgi:hypothetical protein